MIGSLQIFLLVVHSIHINFSLLRWTLSGLAISLRFSDSSEDERVSLLWCYWVCNDVTLHVLCMHQLGQKEELIFRLEASELISL